MFARMTLIGMAMALAFSLVGCAAAPEPPSGLEPEPVPQESPAAGMRLAPGLYDLADGTVQAIGTLERSDLEGGFWAVVGGTEAEGDVGKVIAVIANGDALTDQLTALEGRTVDVLGTRVEGASVRMAGPEIEATSVSEIDDTPGPAE